MDKSNKINMGAAPPNNDATVPGVTPEYPTLIVMIAVLAIILIFCFWGAPGIRDYCKRNICCHCPMDEPREQAGTPTDDRSPSPTIILLPFGRMVVIDRNVITRLQTDQSGIDFMELSANLIRAHQLRYTSQPSILDSEGTSKGLSPISLGYSPPSYEDIFGDKSGDLPPSYSELSLLFRQRQLQMSEGCEMQSFQRLALMGGDGIGVEETVLNISEVIIEQPINLPEENHQVDEELEEETEKDNVTLGNCKYCVLTLEEDRRAKIRCYCDDNSASSMDNPQEGSSRISSDSAAIAMDNDCGDALGVVKDEICDRLKESSL